MATTIQQIELPKKARALDTSGNNNHGQIYSGRGLEFDGVSDYIHTPLDGNPGNFGNQSDFETTIAFWVKVNDFVGGNAFMQWARTGDVSDGSPFVLLALNGTDGSSRLYVDNSYHNLTHKFKAETWYRFVVTRTASDNTWRVYINGVADVTHDDSGSPNLQAHADSFYLGTGYSRYFSGAFSNAQIWNKPFTQADVTYDYLNPESLALNNSGTALTESNLKLWYPMQDGHRGQQSYILDGANTGLGDEMISNGDFSNGTTGWTKATTASATQEIVDGKLRMYSGTAGDNSNQCSSTNVITAGKDGVMYRFTVDMSDPVGMANASIRLDGIYDASNVISFGEGSNTVHFKAYRDFTSIKFIAASHSDYYTIDNVSLKPINDKHHATTVFYGDEILDNPTFTSDLSDWTLSSSTAPTYVSGNMQMNSDGVTFSYARQSFTTVVGRTYGVSGNITVHGSSNTIEIGTSAGGADLLNYSTVGTGDIPIQTFVATGTTTHIGVKDGGAAAGNTYASVSVKEIGVASGWTDADQQLHIPQTALQSYNELAWFDGASEDTVALDTLISTRGNNWSLSFWIIKEGAAGTYSYIIGDWGDANELIAIKNSDNTLQFRDSDSDFLTISTTAIVDNKWTHVVVTATGDTSITAYINGVAQSAVAANATSLKLQNFVSGRSSSASNGAGTGTMNEISYYNDVLTSDEVLDLFNDGKAKSALEASGSAGLVGYWRNNGLSEWKDLKGSNDGNTTASVTETILIPQGVDSTRDTQGFIMNKQKDTSCLNFTSKGDKYVRVQDSPTVQLAGTAASWVFWVKLDSLSDGDQKLMSKAPSTGNPSSAYQIRTNNDDLLFQIYSGSWRTDTRSDFFTSTGWTHVVVTIDSSNNVNFYKNGDVFGSEADIGYAVPANTGGLHVGARVQSTGVYDEFLKGQIDGVLLYNKELDSTEVLRNYNATKGNHRN